LGILQSTQGQTTAIRPRNATDCAYGLYGLPEDELKAAQAGFDAHMVKPADLTRLAEFLEGANIQQP
jgi:hypothetical protein